MYQKQLDNITRCQNTRLIPSFQTTPEIPDGIFMAGQKPVCHIDRVRATKIFLALLKEKINKGRPL